MDTKNYRGAEYMTSATKSSQLPPDEGIEIAFAGRSNAGKSSALNTLTDNRKLARISKTPGRTQMINLFSIDQQRRLVDLPGYGYAKVPKATKEYWQHTMSDYLFNRACLKGIVLVMDIRHPLKVYDQQMIEWSFQTDLPVHILLSKADKLKFGAAKNTLLSVQKELNVYKDMVSVQLFSSLSKTGLDELVAQLNQWFELG